MTKHPVKIDVNGVEVNMTLDSPTLGTAHHCFDENSGEWLELTPEFFTAVVALSEIAVTLLPLSMIQ